MAIRIRTINNEVVAICAAKSTPQKGDIYLDDNIHHALTQKFENDFNKMGFLSLACVTGSLPETTEIWNKAQSCSFMQFFKWLEELR